MPIIQSMREPWLASMREFLCLTLFSNSSMESQWSTVPESTMGRLNTMGVV